MTGMELKHFCWNVNCSTL